MLRNIRTVLVEMSHTGSMGFVVRIMKTMGLTNLWLVSPLVKPDSQAIALAAGASDVVGSAHIVDTLDGVLAGCNLVAGISARSYTLSWPVLDPHECDLKDVAETANTPVALMFGRERVGLASEELQKCHYHIAAVANPEYSLLNLAMAVQVIVYKVCMAWSATQGNGKQVKYEETPYPLTDDLECLYGYLEQTLLAAGFIRESHPRQVVNKLRRLPIRARPEGQELNVLRRILASIGQQNEGDKA